MASLGYIGLGAMGGRIADRLLSKGHTVIGHNRTRSKAQWLLDKGMTWGDSPRAVAAAADVTSNQFLTAARGLGLEKEDCAVLFHVLAKLSGVPA
jgi:3-hydroxyisobutyrate dehydrogenase-like beta-hydroxyacid dehydrogenase